MTEKSLCCVCLTRNQYYCMIFKLPQSPAVFFWFCLFVFFVIVVFFMNRLSYKFQSNLSFQEDCSYSSSWLLNHTNAGSSFDEDRHALNLLCLVPSIIVSKALQLDDEVEGMLFWEKDYPFPKSLGNEVLRWKTLWQSADGELPNNLLLALGACDEDRISQTSIVFWSLPALYLNFDLILIRSNKLCLSKTWKLRLSKACRFRVNEIRNSSIFLSWAI